MLTSGQLELEDTRAVIRYEETLDESLPAQQAVSYTHLDVYKRQALTRATSSLVSKGLVT